MRKNIINSGKFFILLFLLLVFMNCYWGFWRENELATMAQNPRTRENLGIRGGFLSRTGEYLAKNDNKNGEVIRVYPEGELTAHTVGYLDPVLGKAGLEYTCDELLRSRPFPMTIEGFKERWEEGHPKGYNIYLTLDMKLCRIASKAMGNHRGAVVAINPSTGELLVMVSKPGFDANLVGKKWNSYKEDTTSPLLDRAIEGDYPPGSIFKVLVLSAALEKGVVKESDTFDCPGYIEVDGHKFHCSHTHGHQTLKQAMANSCNVAFACIGLKLGEKNLLDYFKKFFGADYNLFLPVLHSKLSEESVATNTLLAQTSFGQGELALTPLEACLMVSGVANGGKIMYPFLIKEVRDMKNRVIEKEEPKILSNPIYPSTAQVVSSMMESVVEEGTGYKAEIEGIRVAGKTGTAEQPGGIPHAWFVGFAPVENPKIAVAVLIEEGGFGGDTAAPIAREIILEAMREQE